MYKIFKGLLFITSIPFQRDCFLVLCGSLLPYFADFLKLLEARSCMKSRHTLQELHEELTLPAGVAWRAVTPCRSCMKSSHSLQELHEELTLPAGVEMTST